MTNLQITIHVATYNLAHEVDRRPLSQRVAILVGAVNSALYQVEYAISESARLSARERLDLLRTQCTALRQAVTHDRPGNSAELLSQLDQVDELLG